MTSTRSLGAVLIAVTFMLIAGCGRHASEAASEAPLHIPHGAAVPISMHHGINIFGAFEHTKTVSGDGGQISDFVGTGVEPPPYSPTELKAMGFDFVRFPVNPAPLLENPPAVRDRLIAEAVAGVKPYLDAGMTVVFDLHFWKPDNATWNPDTVLAGSGTEAFNAYRELVTAVAKQLAAEPAGKVVLEPFNEPPHTMCKNPAWYGLQNRLIASVRDASPTLPVVVTGCLGHLDEMLLMNSKNTDFSDPNLIVNFHFYDPFLFTHQGYPGRPYIREVPYPSRLGSEKATTDAALAALDAMHKSPIEAELAKHSAIHDIHLYFVPGTDRQVIAARMGQAVNWARANNVPPTHLMIGEFSAINWLETDTEARKTARLAWDSDVRSVADSLGIGWAWWGLPKKGGPIYN